MTLLHQAAQKAVEALKPCPFCGGDAELDAHQSYAQFPPNGRTGTRIAVYCRDCGADIGICREDVPDIEPEQVFHLWNCRTRPDDLVMLVGQLVHSLRKAAPGHALADRAVDYLKRNGLQGSPLRTAALQHQEVPREPVAWMTKSGFYPSRDCIPTRDLPPLGNPVPLYASPSTPQQQEAGSDALDARRYRWLRKNAHCTLLCDVFDFSYSQVEHWTNSYNRAKLDEAIDAATPSTPESAEKDDAGGGKLPDGGQQ